MADDIKAPGALEAFEKYRTGVPLNDELRAVAEGHVPVMEPAHPTEVAEVLQERQARPGLLDWRPSREQLGWLQELRASEGWPVLMQLLEKELENAREEAIRLSEYQPLENKDAISMAWAYRVVMKSVIQRVPQIVSMQLARLKRQE